MKFFLIFFSCLVLGHISRFLFPITVLPPHFFCSAFLLDELNSFISHIKFKIDIDFVVLLLIYKWVRMNMGLRFATWNSETNIKISLGSKNKFCWSDKHSFHSWNISICTSINFLYNFSTCMLRTDFYSFIYIPIFEMKSKLANKTVRELEKCVKMCAV